MFDKDQKQNYFFIRSIFGGFFLHDYQLCIENYLWMYRDDNYKQTQNEVLLHAFVKWYFEHIYMNKSCIESLPICVSVSHVFLMTLVT